MTTLDQYAGKYPDIRMERRDGILQVTFHTEGKSLKWSDDGSHRDFGYAFADIAADVANKVVIMTGVGDDFINDFVFKKKGRRRPSDWDTIYWEGKRLLMNLLNIEVPIIAAVNGPATIHAEVALLSDIVLAADHATFEAAKHFPKGKVPGDGVHIVWPMLLGINRGRYFLMTGQTLTATEAHRLGLVGEVLPKEKLLPRAWELAEQMAAKPALTLRYTRVLFTEHIKRTMQDYLGYGLALEGLAALDGQEDATGKLVT
ncbi:MAG: enoyl-CoA hydratase/isomerase family protein [Chloroflexi bacterium]|nr:enoyl-CoA hydratase/isomerase family protein [Chloroflexota bacterium]